MLRIESLTCRYGAIQATREIDIEVADGEIVTMIGANGAGKSSTIGAISGVVEYTGTIMLDGAPLSRHPSKVVRAGVVQVPEGREIFPELTVEENLLVGAYTRRDHAGIRQDLEEQLTRFPVLRERYRQSAANLSGGQQQMLAIARAMMAKPRLLMLDEPSLGLAPVLVREIMSNVRRINAERGVTILLVEQNIGLALELADRCYVLEQGRVVLSGTSAEVRANDYVRQAYLGWEGGENAAG